MVKRTLQMVCAVICIFFLAICFSCTKEKESEETSKSSEKTVAVKQKKISAQKITIAQFGHVFVYLPIYIAKEKGFFKEQGLDVTYVSTGGDEKTWAAVTSGSAQFGVADPTFVAIAREKGDETGQIIASIIDGVPFWGVSKKDTKIKNVSDFAGHRVATYPAPSTNFALMDRIVKKHKLDTRIVQGAFGTLLPIVANERADIAMVLEPTTSLAVKQGYNVVFSYKNLYGDFALTGLSTTKSYISEHRDICQKVVNALQKAYQYAYKDFEGAVAVATQQFPDFDKEALQMGVKRMIDDETIPQTAVLKEKSWNEAISLRRFLGDIKANAPFADNVDNQFAVKADQEMSK